jgi:hypothetical protein
MNPRIYKNKIYSVDEVNRLVEILNSSINPPPRHKRELISRGKDGRLYSVAITFGKYSERFSYEAVVIEEELRIPTHSGFEIYRNHKKVAKLTYYKERGYEVLYAVEVYLEDCTRYRAFYSENSEYAEVICRNNLLLMSPTLCAHAGTGLYHVAMRFVENTLK